MTNYYKDLLNDFYKSEFNNKLLDIRIADEMHCAFDKESKDFETLCSFTKQMYFDCDGLEPHDIVWAIYEWLEQQDLKLCAIEDLQEWLYDNEYDIRDYAYDLRYERN